MHISSAEESRSEPYLLACDISAGYGGTEVVSGVGVQVGHGEIAAIIGPNGSGKSTFLKALVGMLRPMRGRISLGDVDISRSTATERARMGLGYVPQTRHIFSGLTVEENLRLGGYCLRKQHVKSRIENIIALYPSLAPMLRRPAHKLSGGEQKLVAIARVMMTEPTIYVLDEPASNLSAGRANEFFREHLLQLAASGAAVLLVEQKAKLALEVADWAYLMVTGKLRMSASASAMLEDSTVAEMFLGEVPEDQPKTLKDRETIGSEVGEQ